MNNLLNYLKKYFNFLLFMVKCNYIVNLGIIKMKNLELNNLLSLGNIVVAQLYEENLKNKLKDLCKLLKFVNCLLLNILPQIKFFTNKKCKNLFWS
ncbi:hypothetical protein B5M19_02540 [Mesomycoplasma hyopneumoniae]|uniref:Uncharacterized protein n=2 Tax=Mesomycoplasma hyopneumoniae (strain 168) TaxID=907287 RepID=E4QSP1_MESH1|nr:Predicted protein [Mesomycoplasma hyopneumoniae 168]AGM22018.1 hypothetical protein MHP168L_238 [Mesomycoplasma hyopneumoniae 168-L]OWY73830.1 hypothetical protein B5M19_02540 [Mesomycoplasma hyopneumoniae]